MEASLSMLSQKIYLLTPTLPFRLLTVLGVYRSQTSPDAVMGAIRFVDNPSSIGTIPGEFSVSHVNWPAVSWSVSSGFYKQLS